MFSMIFYKKKERQRRRKYPYSQNLWQIFLKITLSKQRQCKTIASSKRASCVLKLLIGIHKKFRFFHTSARVCSVSRNGTFNIDKSPAKGWKRCTLSVTKKWQPIKSPSNKARNDIKYLCSTSLWRSHVVGICFNDARSTYSRLSFTLPLASVTYIHPVHACVHIRNVKAICLCDYQMCVHPFTDDDRFLRGVIEFTSLTRSVRRSAYG